jgi:hypothetical protein
MPTIAVLSDDLIDFGKVASPARRIDASAIKCKSIDELIDRITKADLALVVVDLHLMNDALPTIVELKVPIVGYGSHIDAERLRNARTAGCQLVLPRSAFFERVDNEIANWISGTFR